MSGNFFERVLSVLTGLVCIQSDLRHEGDNGSVVESLQSLCYFRWVVKHIVLHWRFLLLEVVISSEAS